MKLKSITKFIRFSITGTAVAAATLTSMAAGAGEFKHVAVPPQDIAAQQLAQAQDKGLFSHSTMLPIYADKLSGNSAKGQAFEQKIYLDGATDSPIVLLSPQADNLFITVSNDQGKVVYDELAQASKALAVNDVQVGPQSFKGKTLSLSNATAGEYTVKLTHKGINKSSSLRKGSDKAIAGYLVFKGDTEFQLYSYLDNNITTQNNDINLVAYMADTTTDRGERQLMIKKPVVTNTIHSATATVTSPSGKVYTVKLNDEGINGDKYAGDGKFGGHMPTAEVGVYTNQLQITGQRRDGKRFTRTTTDIYPVAAQSFELSNSPAQLKLTSGTAGLVSVPVKNLGHQENVFLAAEVWGTNADGEQQSAAWVGGIVTPSDNKKNTQLELSFDTRWLSRENLKAPFTLKSVRLQTVDSNVPLALRDKMALKSSSKKLDNQLSFNGLSIGKEITKDMLMGKAPVKAKENVTSATGSRLLLVHGYCSGQAWYANEWSNASEFKDYKQNISHDTFAKRVRDFGASWNSFGVVAHSQGGAASLHLYSKYWSGLDNATGGRLIQSVGTPYQGTALAGNLAALGDVFGAGCGTNTDLTYSGASNWLATIPTWARNQVNYYTTAFNDRWWAYDYCHLATDLFLDDPEDGTTEKWSGQLSGGVNRGHKSGQCHTSGMRDPAQTRDSSRNSTMNSNAAR